MVFEIVTNYYFRFSFKAKIFHLLTYIFLQLSQSIDNRRNKTINQIFNPVLVHIAFRFKIGKEKKNLKVRQKDLRVMQHLSVTLSKTYKPVNVP